MVSSKQAGGAPRRVAVRASSALLMLALLGFALRGAGAAPVMQQWSQAAALMLIVLAPVWAMLGGMLSTVYLMLSTSRPYSMVQHLLELVAAAALIAVLQPPHFS